MVKTEKATGNSLKIWYEIFTSRKHTIKREICPSLFVSLVLFLLPETFSPLL
jgi:hypothetical protein